MARKYILGPGIDEPIAMTAASQTHYYHANTLGTVIGLTDATGAVAETYQYTAYGQASARSAIGNPYLYTGRRLDTETGLYYYRARYYDANLRRFLQTDPIGFAGGMNLYAYVENDPINWVDPHGLARPLDEISSVLWPHGIGFEYTPPIGLGHRYSGSSRATHIPGIPRSTLKGTSGSRGSWSAPRQYYRIRHYTNSKGLKGIMRDNVIKASDQNKVFYEPARGKPLSQHDAEITYGIKPGRGRHIVETDVPAERVNRVKNPITGVEELQIEGDVPLLNPSFIER